MFIAKVLFKISGSIAAYKSAVIISKLVQSGYTVQTVVTSAALQFIGRATLEGLTGKPVLTDQFEPGKMMDHINLVKWADITILAPATANTINRLASGLGDNLVSTLFLAHDWEKPYLIAPAMNTKMYNHPATRSALEKIKNWGVTVLPTTEGYLACGDEGQGKMLEPDAILPYIMEACSSVLPAPETIPRVIITAGGTREAIDAVRFVSNISTGYTGASLADNFIRNGISVTYLHGPQTRKPTLLCDCKIFTSAHDLDIKLEQLVSGNQYDALLHLAAVSDYTPETLLEDGKHTPLPLKSKIASGPERLTIAFRRTSKIVHKIKTIAANKRLKLVAFKFTAFSSTDQQRQAVDNLFAGSQADIVVGNDISDRIDGRQTDFTVYSKSLSLEPVTAPTVHDLGMVLRQKLFENKDQKS